MVYSIKELDSGKASYFTHKQPQKPGSPLKLTRDTPKLFTPLKIRNIELPNRIGVSPMCTYSGKDGVATPWHFAHYGSLMRGAGVIILESTAINEGGRTTANDLGIYTQEQVEALSKITELAHSQNSLIGIQLDHAGRNGSTLPLFYSLLGSATKDDDGWPNKLVAPSAIPFKEDFPVPKELTLKEIEELVNQFGVCAKNSVEAGFDFIEIHAAHGFLIHEFLSSYSNKRTDKYGGSFENRIRFLLEIIDKVRQVVPDDYPIFLRISVTDSREDIVESWKLADSLELVDIVLDRGIDLIDCSNGGVIFEPNPGPTHSVSQREAAMIIKKHIGNRGLVASVGGIYSGTEANSVLEDEGVDLVLLGSRFLRHPTTVWDFADDVEVDIFDSIQRGWAFPPKFLTND
ncbi:hypothetical protein LJB42_002280 [Komagataella kurtzmanii]|nr:hypothetical protein LJB42_002280 [Komagataella kurtzmanii]